MSHSPSSSRLAGFFSLSAAMSDTFWKGHDAMDKKKPDYGSWRSMAAGTIGTGKIKKSFLDKDTDFQTTVDGLLGLMPIGARNVTYIPGEAMEKIKAT